MSHLQCITRCRLSYCSNVSKIKTTVHIISFRDMQHLPHILIMNQLKRYQTVDFTSLFVLYLLYIYDYWFTPFCFDFWNCKTVLFLYGLLSFVKALTQLHQLEVLGCKLVVEFAKNAQSENFPSQLEKTRYAQLDLDSVLYIHF